MPRARDARGRFVSTRKCTSVSTGKKGGGKRKTVCRDAKGRFVSTRKGSSTGKRQTRYRPRDRKGRFVSTKGSGNKKTSSWLSLIGMD